MLLADSRLLPGVENPVYEFFFIVSAFQQAETDAFPEQQSEQQAKHRAESQPAVNNAYSGVTDFGQPYGSAHQKTDLSADKVETRPDPCAFRPPRKKVEKNLHRNLENQLLFLARTPADQKDKQRNQKRCVINCGSLHAVLLQITTG